MNEASQDQNQDADDAFDAASLIAPLQARAVAYSKATARATIQAAPWLLAAIRFRPFTDLIDIACGPGHIAGAASALGARALGVDLSVDMVAVARTRHFGAEFRIGDATSLKELDERYDFALCNFGMPHFPDRPAAMREALRILRPGGRYAFTQWRAASGSPFFAAFDEIARSHGQPAGVAPTDGSAFEFGDADTACAAMTAAGFVDVEAQEAPIIYDAPDGDFLNLFDDLALPFASPRIEGEALDAFRTALNKKMSSFMADGRYRIPMPAIVASGRRP